MTIEWNKSLATGIEWQDKHHKELFRRMKALIDAMEVGLGKEEVGKLFKFLDDYFVVHFEAEEQAMNKYNYPGSVYHIKEHTEFIERMSRLKQECEYGVTTTAVIKIKREVVDWFINHIGDVDKKLGSYILRVDVERKGKA